MDSFLPWKRDYDFNLTIQCKNDKTLDKLWEQHSLLHMLFASSILPKATNLAVLSWSMLKNGILPIQRTLVAFDPLFQKNTMPLSQINHVTDLQRAILTPPVENTFFPQMQLIMKQSRMQQTVLQTISWYSMQNYCVQGLKFTRIW